MNITLRTIVFKIYMPSGHTIEKSMPVAGDDEMVTWVAQEFADVNNAGVIATHNGKDVAVVGNVQS